MLRAVIRVTENSGKAEKGDDGGARGRGGRSEGVGLFPGKYSICEANFVTYREFSLFVPLTKSNLSLRSCVTGRKINSLLPSTTPFRHAEAIHFFSFFSIVAPPPSDESF